MKITVLSDNIASEKKGLKGEWGLSLLIEANDSTVLLDTGASSLFRRNGDILGIDLSCVDAGVLSHAHYDHSDGMECFFNTNAKSPFYLSGNCRENCYGKRWIFSKYIGIRKGLMKKYSERISFIEGRKEICNGVYLLPHSTDKLELLGKKTGIYIKKNHRLVPDNFEHEQSLIFRTKKGLVIFNSCSHGGADNIINEVKAAFPDEKIYALIGGFHLYKASEADVCALAERIESTGIEKIYTGHCTGEKAFEILSRELRSKAHQLYCGLEIEA
jgi:7,8-dihydropterin-6-yl-methyl-4-(beta-D-ribofuranosyl)aminobenzene 5'-phosphate synthase